MPRLTRPLLRRCALALAVMQISAYAAAPVIEALTDRAPGPISIEQSHSKACVVIHGPDNCLACHLLTASGQRPTATAIPCAVMERAALQPRATRSRQPRAPPRTLHSRAPPTDLA